MKVKLSSVAHVLPGYAFRTAVEYAKEGQYMLLQAKDISSSFITDISNLPKVKLPEGAKVTPLEKNDILIINRGFNVNSFESTLYDLDEKNVIVASTVFIIRSHSPKILAEYLCRQLNTKAVQKQIFDSTTGASVKALSRSALGEIEIPCPSISIQQQYVDAANTMEILKSLLSKKISIINKLNDALLASALGK